MSHLLDLPVALAAAPFDPVGKSVGEVARQVEHALARTEIEPEWVSVANSVDDPNEEMYGLRPSAEWPNTFSRRRRLSLSVERGTSEGWIIQADSAPETTPSASGGPATASQPLRMRDPIREEYLRNQP
jgi:hypothetical protein